MSEQFDFEAMTLDEVETIEALTGTSIDNVVADGKPKGKNLKAIIYVLKLRENPGFKIEDAGKFTIAEVAQILGGNEKKAEN